MVLTCLLRLVELWRAPGPPMEEGFMLVFPELVLDGQVPNRDFLHLYGPGSLWVLAGAFEVLGTTLVTERAIGFLQQLGLAFGILALLRPWGRWVAAAGGATAAMIVVPPIGLTALAWTGGVALGLWSLNGSLTGLAAEPGSARRRRLLLVAGLLAGAALLYRPDLVLAVGLSSVVLWPGLDRSGRRRFAGGLAVGVSPYLVHVATAGVGNVVTGLVLEPVFELRGGRRLPLPPPGATSTASSSAPGSSSSPRGRCPPLPRPRSSACGWRCSWRPMSRSSSPASTPCAGVTAGCSSSPCSASACSPRRSSGRTRRTSPGSAAFLSACCPRPPPRESGPGARCWPSGRQAMAAAAVPLLATLALAPHFTWAIYTDYVARSVGAREIEAGTIRRGDRTFPYGRPDAVEAVNAMLPDVERVMRPGDTLFVGTADLRKTPYSEAFLYYLLPELAPATRYIEMDPGIANAEDSGLADELRAADIAILSSIRDDWDEPNDSQEFGPDEPNQVIEEDFCLVDSYGDGLSDRGLYELYRRC